MKKTIALVCALVLLGSFAVASFAQPATQAASKKQSETSTEVIKGKIISIDATKNEVVIKEDKTGTEKTISVGAQVLSTLKADEEVRVKIKAGTTMAESVKKVMKPVSATMKSEKK